MESKKNELINQLSKYFSDRMDVAFAFLFGSAVKGMFTQDSDIDVAVYFYPLNSRFDLEDDIYFKYEDEIWNDLEQISGYPVDFVVLNRSSASICASVYLEGLPLIIKDQHLYWMHFSVTTDLAEEYRAFTEDYIRIKKRSMSLSPVDRTRLLQISDFIESELSDYRYFEEISKQSYLEDSMIRRNVERWIENLVNASIDCAKIIIASRKQPVPQTYREMLLRLGTVNFIDQDSSEKLASFSRLRNILAHEYLDIRYPQIKKFLEGALPVYTDLLNAVERIITDK